MTHKAIDKNGKDAELYFPLAGSKLAFSSGGSAIAAADFNAICQFIEIYADQSCYFKLGPTGTTATTTDLFLPANTTRVYDRRGATRIAAMALSTNGNLYINQLA